jgi:hypothetical protein
MGISPICDVHNGEALGLLSALKWMHELNLVPVDLGLLSALKWVHELNLVPVDFELDSTKVVDSNQTNFI